MGIQKRRSAHAIYQEYLEWFHRNAVDDAAPRREEEMTDLRVLSEDAFNDDFITTNRVYFLIPIPPAQSRSGKMECFLFSELNLIERAYDENGADDITRFMPVEYRRE